MHNITVLAIDNSSIHTLRARSTTRVVSIDACLKCMHTTLLASIYIYIYNYYFILRCSYIRERIIHHVIHVTVL